MHQLPLELPSVCCPYCRAAAELLMSSAELYNGRDHGPVWICRLCEAWVGVHENSPRYMPLGRLANAELRAAKQAAHAMFDPLWQRKLIRGPGIKKRARGDGYQWLADQLGIPFEQCHIGEFDLEMCKRVVEICAPYHPSMKGRTAAPVVHNVSLKSKKHKEPLTHEQQTKNLSI